jgi:hypothetical protein
MGDKRNFLVVDIYASRVEWTIYDYDEDSLQFVKWGAIESETLR